MKLTHPEVHGNIDTPLKYYEPGEIIYSKLTKSPDAARVGEITLHLTYPGPMGSEVSQMLTLSPEEVARFLKAA